MLEFEESFHEPQDIKLIAEKIFEKYIYEIFIVLGCLVRWHDENKGVTGLVKWLLGKELFRPITATLSSEEAKDLKFELEELIGQLDVNVTAIKASLRTLLRASKERKEELVSFVET